MISMSIPGCDAYLTNDGPGWSSCNNQIVASIEIDTFDEASILDVVRPMLSVEFKSGEGETSSMVCFAGADSIRALKAACELALAQDRLT